MRSFVWSNFANYSEHQSNNTVKIENPNFLVLIFNVRILVGIWGWWWWGCRMGIFEHTQYRPSPLSRHILRLTCDISNLSPYTLPPSAGPYFDTHTHTRLLIFQNIALVFYRFVCQFFIISSSIFTKKKKEMFYGFPQLFCHPLPPPPPLFIRICLLWRVTIHAFAKFNPLKMLFYLLSRLTVQRGSLTVRSYGFLKPLGILL